VRRDCARQRTSLRDQGQAPDKRRLDARSCDGGQASGTTRTATPVASTSRADAESRPVNLCAIYLIGEPNNKKIQPSARFRLAPDLPSLYPRGRVSQHWLYCNGDTFIATAAAFIGSTRCLGVANGGIKMARSSQDFAVPDFARPVRAGVAAIAKAPGSILIARVA